MAKETVRVAGKVAGHTSVEGQVESVQLDERVVDPNSPYAVQIPESGVGGNENTLDVHIQPTPNEAAGDEPEVQINPHTGENVAEATQPSPVPANVEAVESVDDVLTVDDLQPTVLPDEDKVQPEPVEEAPAEEPAPEPAPEPEPTPVEPTPDTSGAPEPVEPDPAVVDEPAPSE